MTKLLDEIRTIVRENRTEIQFDFQNILNLINVLVSDSKNPNYINDVATVLKEEIDNNILKKIEPEESLAKLHISCKTTISMEDASKIIEEIKLDLDQLGMEEITFSSEDPKLLEVLCE